METPLDVISTILLLPITGNMLTLFSIFKVNRQPLESFKSGNKEAGVVFGSIPIYRVS